MVAGQAAEVWPPCSISYAFFSANYSSGGEVASHQRPLSLLVHLLPRTGNTVGVFLPHPQRNAMSLSDRKHRYSSHGFSIDNTTIV